MEGEEGKNWEGVRRSGSDVDIIPDVKTQISQRWFWPPLSQQWRRNGATIMVEAAFLHRNSLNINHTLPGTKKFFTLPTIVK